MAVTAAAAARADRDTSGTSGEEEAVLSDLDEASSQRRVVSLAHQSRIRALSRTHLGLGKDAPLRRSVQRSGTIIVTPILSGLHHRYARI